MPEPRFNAAIAKFDALNARDPHGKELLYAQRMTEWLLKLEPAATEALQLATRAQHLMRWEIPRESFPKDRAGYLKWRTTLYDYHADRAAEVLREVGYDDAIIARVRSLIRKEKLKIDPEAQTLEDVICLVFLENYFEEFSREHDEEKLIRILQRTWKKMSPRGHEAAMTLKLSADQMRLIQKALGEAQVLAGQATGFLEAWACVTVCEVTLNPSAYSPAEERMNLLTHAAGAVMSVAALVILLLLAAPTRDPWRIVTVAIFGMSLVILYSASACYHACRDEIRRRRFKSIDHAAIYLLIAGTYTPFMLVLVRGAWGWSICCVLWSLALAGVIFKIHFAGRFKIASTLVYIAMGWIGLIAIHPIRAAVPRSAIELLIAGGVAYTSGVLFYLWNRLRFNHAIWHLFVMAGSTLHFFAVLRYVVPEM